MSDCNLLSTTKNDLSHIPYFEVSDPFDLVYRKSSTLTPVGPHTHNALEIYLTLSDLPDVLINNTVSNVSKGSLIIIPPYSIHQLFNQKDITYERYIVSINNGWLNLAVPVKTSLLNASKCSSQPLIIKLSSSKQAVLLNKLDAFMKAPTKTPLSYYAEFFNILDSLDTVISDFMNQKHQSQLFISGTQETVNQIIAYINAHLTEQITLDDIASHFYMNKDYLARLFKKHTHTTIGNFISIQKINIAQSLLAKGASVAEVQEETGFSSYAYFFRFFKKMTGISPSQYRKNASLLIKKEP